MSNVFFTFATPVLLLCYLLSSAAALVLVDFEDCANAVNNSYFNNPSVDYLRDQNGNPTYNISTAWGITYQACTDICTSGQAFMEWNAFSTQVSTWLLPWLSLTAQLPFETKSTTMNFQALYLALGCPLLIIYSLGLTILNARSINRQVRQLKESEDISKIPLEPRAELLKVLDNARTVLIETQSVPLRVVNGPKRQIAQLVVNPNYGYWWTKIAEGILRTKREWTYSLSAQLALVITAQLFSIIDYFTSPADDTSITVGLALNSVWIWMIPVTLGFVRVGTQTSAGSIKTALKSVNVPDLGEKESTIGLADKTRYVTFEKRSPSMRHCSSDYVSRLQERSPLSSCVRVNAPLSTEIPSGSLELPERRGGNSTRSADLESGRMLEVPSQSMSEDTGQASSAETLLPGLEREQTLSPLSSQGWLERLLTISFHGDESEPGPIYNYARVWSHRNVVAYLIGAFECSIRKQANKRVVRPGTAWNHVPGEYNRNLEGNAEQLSKFISDEERDEIKPPSHSLELPGLVKDLILVASTTTILFWSTTGSGILIAYETPTVGLGTLLPLHKNLLLPVVIMFSREGLANR